MQLFPYRYRILALLTVFSALTAYAGRGVWIIDAFAANIAAGFLGALATVVLIDRAAERRSEESRERVERIALAQARRPIYDLAQTFADMLKASWAQRPSPLPQSYAELFATEHAAHLDWIDLAGDAGKFPSRDWYTHLQETIPRVSRQLSEILDKYMAFVALDFVELVESIRDDSFVSFLQQLASIRQHLRSQGKAQDYVIAGHADSRDAFLAKLVRLIEYHDAHSASALPFLADHLNRDDVSPRLASSRLPSLPTMPQVAST